MGCCQASLNTQFAEDVIKYINVPDLMGRHLRHEYSFTGFNEFMAMSTKYTVRELTDDTMFGTREMLPRDIVQATLIRGIVRFLERNKKNRNKLYNLNEEQKHYIATELKNALVYYILGIPILFNSYNQVHAVGIRDDTWDRFWHDVLGESDINVNTKNPIVIHQLGTQFCKVVLRKVGTFDVSGIMDEIYGYLFQNEG
jgi:hypothetical protein